MKKNRDQQDRFSIDLELALGDKKKLTALVKQLGKVTSLAITPIPGNDFHVNVFRPGFLGDKFSPRQAADVEESLNHRLASQLPDKLDVAPLGSGFGLMADHHTETLSLGLSSEQSFGDFKEYVFEAFMATLAEMGCKTLDRLTKKDKEEILDINISEPRVDIARFMPNRLSMHPIEIIIEESYEADKGISDQAFLENPMNLVPYSISLRGLRLNQRANKHSPRLTPGHESILPGTYDHTGRIISK